MFEEFYEKYEPEEQEVVALIHNCIRDEYNSKGDFWVMTVVTLGVVFCNTEMVSTKEERLEWPVSAEDRNGKKGWRRFENEQICRLKLRRMKEELSQNLPVRPWCIEKVVKADEDCPALQAVLDDYHRPVVIQDAVLGELQLDKDFSAFEGEIKWCGRAASLSLEVTSNSKSSWNRARRAARKLLIDCDTWDEAMRALAAKKLTALANDQLSQNKKKSRCPQNAPITEDELAQRIRLIDLMVTPGGSFNAYFDCDELFVDQVVMVNGSLKKGVKHADIEG